MTIHLVLLYIGIGVFAGISAGLFGLGGGLVIIPALFFRGRPVPVLFYTAESDIVQPQLGIVPRAVCCP